MIAKLIRYELKMWLALFRWILRRKPGVGAGDRVFGYTSAVMPILWVFIVLSAIEVPAMHLILPWHAARTVLLAVGAWGLVWMVGIMAGMRVYPHVVGERGLRVRQGFTVDFTVPWEAVQGVSRRNRALQSSRTVQVDDATLSIVVLSQTHVDIALRQPMELPPTNGKAVTALRIHVDDADGFVTLAREHLAASRVRAGD